MEGGALLEESFKTFADDYVLFCHITTHIEGEKYGDLLEKKGGQGFPYLVFMDSDGNVIAKHESFRRVDAFKETGKKASEFLDLGRKAKSGDKTAQVDYLIARVELGHLTEKDAEAEAKKVGKLPPEKEQAFQSALSNLAVQEVLTHLPRDSRDKAVTMAGEKFAAMRKAGRPAPSSDELAQPYWMLTMMYAEQEKDAKTYELGLNALKKKFGDNPRAQQFFKQAEETLKGLKEESEK